MIKTAIYNSLVFSLHLINFAWIHIHPPAIAVIFPIK